MVIGNEDVYEVICFVVRDCDTGTLLLRASNTDDYHRNGGLCYRHGAPNSLFSFHNL